MSDKLLITPVPALCTLLVEEEQRKGRALTETEVMNIAEHCACIAMPADVARRVEESRGYSDIDPGNAWQEWLSFRRWFYQTMAEE